MLFRSFGNAYGTVMEKSKKSVRSQFRTAVFTRDKLRCRCCGVAGSDRQSLEGGQLPTALDAHHITDRHEMPNGGYVKENGITVCNECHIKCEEFWRTGVAIEGFSPEDLYNKIGSSKEIAILASEKL